MKQKLQFVVLLLGIGLLTSCGLNGDKTSELWGETEYYNDFLWNHYEPLVMQRTLCFEWNEDALTDKTPIKLALRARKEDFSYKKAKHIKLYRLKENGEWKPCKNLEFKVKPGTNRVTLGIEFKEEAKDSVYNLAFCVQDAGNIDLVNEENVYNTTHVTPICIRTIKTTKMNPLAKLIMWIGILILTALLLWRLILRRMVFPTFAFSNLHIMYLDGESKKGIEDCNMSDVRKIVCTNTNLSQGRLNYFFTGRVEYVTNPFWTSPVEIIPEDSNCVEIKEINKDGMPLFYRMPAPVITAQNGARKPFVVKKLKTELTANLSIG